MGTFVSVFLWGKPAAVMSAELARHRDVSVRYLLQDIGGSYVSWCELRMMFVVCHALNLNHFFQAFGR